MELLLKSKEWHKENFPKVGDTCISKALASKETLVISFSDCFLKQLNIKTSFGCTGKLSLASNH